MRAEVEQQRREEKEVQVRRKRLGAGAEKEVRRAVGREVLVVSKVRFGGARGREGVGGGGDLIPFRPLRMRMRREYIANPEPLRSFVEYPVARIL